MYVRFEISILLLIFHSSFSEHLLNTTSGIYIGRTVQYRNIPVEQYLGIEYGRINKRFERAEAILRNNDTILNATSFGSVCKPTINICPINSETRSCTISYGIFTLKTSPNEQCLYLNIFLPMINDTNTKKSIFMWIHGGSSQIGTGNLFDGTVLAALGNLIVITFNFRLNVFGFLSTGDQRLEGNLGLYDQLMVLNWIENNIDVLGGDIERITVGGHSAGAPHAYYLAKSPFNNGRIRRLILQSGCPFNIWSHLKSHQALEKFYTIANDNQCGMYKTFDEIFQCLQNKDYYSISEYQHLSYTSANHTNVVLQGEFMKEFRYDLDINHTLTDVDMLIGSNDDEGVHVAVIPLIIEQTIQESLTLQNANLTNIALKFLTVMQPNKSCLYEKALQLYHIDKIPLNCSQSIDCYCSLFYNYSRLISDILFNNDYYRFLIQHIQYSNRTYVYQYSYKTSQEHSTVCNDYLHQNNLVGHFAELEYTWGTPLLFKNLNPIINYIPYKNNSIGNYTNEQIEFTQQLIEQWANFINYGQPNSTTFPDQWTSITNLSDGFIMQLNSTKSQIKQFEIPSTVQFWTNTCPTQENQTIMNLNNDIFIYEISMTIIFCTSFFIFYGLN